MPGTEYPSYVPSILNIACYGRNIYFKTLSLDIPETRLVIGVNDISSNLPLYLPVGSSVAPSLSTSTDSDTGLYWSSADELSIATSGVQRLVIGNNGLIGIGSNKLTTTNLLLKEIAGYGSDPTIAIRNISDNAFRGMVVSEAHIVNGDLMFWNNSSTQSFSFARSAGNVGIAWQVNTKNAGNAQTSRITLTGGENIAKYSILNSYVGIGTSTPSKILEVSDPLAWALIKTTTSTSYGLLDITNTNNTLRLGIENSAGGGLVSGATGYYSVIGSTGNYGLHLIANAAIAATVLPNGNFGIGTTAPDAAMHIESLKNAFTGIGVPSNYHLLVRHPVSSNGVGAGIGFLVSAATTIIGASIVFKRTDSNSKGELQFYTTQDTSSGLPAQAMVISDAGNIGIGTASPLYRLDVQKSISPLISTTGQGILHVANSSLVTTDSAAILFSTLSTRRSQITSGRDSDVYTNAGNLSFSVRRGSDSTFIEAVRITNSGSVGIGTNAPTSLLDIVGTEGDPTLTPASNPQLLRIRGGGNVRLDMGIMTNTPYGAWIQARDIGGIGGAKQLAINPSGGAVGIGTMNPSELLEVYGGNIAQKTSSYKLTVSAGSQIEGSNHLILKSSASYLRLDSTGNMYMDVGSDSSHYLGINNYNATELMRVTGAGRVGIGNVVPSSVLHVYGTSYPMILLEGDGASYDSHLGLRAATGSGQISNYFSGDLTFESQPYANRGTALSTTEIMRITGDGYVSINSNAPSRNSSYKLYVNSGIYSTGWVYGNSGFVGPNWQDPTRAAMRLSLDYLNGFIFYADGYANPNPRTERMRITTSGVAIGTSVPAAPFHVVASSVASGAEEIARFGVADSDAYLKIKNSNPTDTVFTPTIEGYYGGGYSQGLNLIGNVASEASTSVPAMAFTGRTAGGTVVARPAFQFYNHNTAQMTIMGSGQVGIGITSPQYPLHIQAGAVDGTAWGMLIANDASVDSSGVVTGILFRTRGANGAARIKGGLAFQQTGDYGRGSLHILTNNTSNDSIVDLTHSRLTVTSAGNVGIGTTSPDAIIHAYRASGRTLIASTQATSPSTISMASIIGVFSGQSNPTIHAIATSESFADDVLRLEAYRGSSGAYYFINCIRDADGSPSGVFTVKGDGSVCAGAIGLPTGERFSIYTDTYSARIAGDTMGRLNLEDRAVTDANGPFRYIASDGGNFTIGKANRSGTGTTGSTDHILIDVSGWVGIGNTTPTSLLTVGKDTITNSQMTLWGEYQGAGFTNSNTFNFRHGGLDRVRIVTYQASAASNAFNTGFRTINSSINGYNEWMTIIGVTGNIGMGTIAPNRTLDIRGVSNAGFIVASSGSGGKAAGLYAGSAGVALDYDDAGSFSINSKSNANIISGSTSGGTSRLFIDSTGNVGIGTINPSGKLHVLSTTEQLRLAYDDNKYTSFAVNSAGEITVTPSGRIFEIGGGSSKLRLRYDSTYSWTIHTGYSWNAGELQFRNKDGGVGLILQQGGRAGFSIDNPQALIHGVSTNEQLRLGHSIGAYTSFTTNSAGNLGIIPSGQYVGINVPTPAYPLQVRRTGGAGSLGISVDNVVSTDRSVKYHAVPDNSGDFSGHAFYVRNMTTTDNLAMYINWGSNVGIGTNAPGARLHTISTTEQLRLGYDTNSYTSFTDTNTGQLNIVTVSQSGNGTISLQPANGVAYLQGPGTNRLYIMDYARTGAWTQYNGTTIEMVQNSLNVHYINARGTTVFNDTGSDIDFRIEGSGEANLFYIDAGNNRIGIGTSTPAYRVDIGNNTNDTIRIGAQAVNNGVGSLVFGSKSITAQAAKIAGIYGPQYDGALVFYTQASGVDGDRMTERMRIGQQGNVAIGSTTLTNGTLFVNGTIVAATAVYLGGGGYAEWYGNSGYSRISIWANSTYNEVLRTKFDGAAKIGIGTNNPAKALEINNASGDALRLTYNDANGGATTYADLLMTAGGTLNIIPTGSQVGVSGTLRATTIIGANVTSGIDPGHTHSIYSSGTHTHAGVYEPVIAAGTTAQYWRGDKTWQTLDKSAVGLGNVENTALSTWAGTTNITTIGNATANSLSIIGNLTVNGTTTTVNSTTVTVDDPIFTIGGDTAASGDDNKDRGIEFRWHNGSAAKTGFFGFDDSTGYFTFIPDATNTSEVFSGTKGVLDVTRITGTAASWTTPRYISLAGDLSGSGSLDGTADISINATINANSVALGTDTTGNYVASVSNGSYITGGSAGSEGAALTLAVDATHLNTGSKVVARDASGNFGAGTITASLSGNALTATTATNLSGGTVSATSILSTQGVTDAYDGVRIVNPGGAALTTSTNQTGAIKIKLPIAATNSSTLMQFTVKIYEYSTGMCRTLIIGGYNYNSGGWYNVAATQESQNGGPITVRFGYDGTSECVWIGELDTVWVTPQIFVTDFQGGRLNATQAIWASGWNISVVAAFDTVETSTTAYRPLHSSNYNSYAPTLTGTGATGNWGINITGSAAKLTTPRNIALYNGVTGTPTAFDGSANISIPVTAVAASAIVGTIPSTVLGNSSLYVGTTSIALNRPSSSQSLTGITSIDGSAAKWTTPRYISLTGDLAGSGSLDGTVDISISATIQPNSVALGTDTTGNYVTSITNGSYITGGNGGSESAALTLAVDATHLNTGSKVVARDASGNFGAGTITASLSGNALTATTLATPRTIGLYGSASGIPTSFDGSANINILVTAIAASSIVGTIPAGVLSNSSFYLGTTSIALNRASASQSLTGITSIDGSASKWTTPRYISLAGDLAGSGSLDGSANLSINATIQPNSVALGTDTTGNYVASITNGSYITGGNGGSESAALTIAVDATHLNTGSKVVVRDASGNFGAGTITASLSGNALTATTLASARTIALYGAASGTATAFDGSANINIPVTAIAASSIMGVIPSTVLGNSSLYVGTTAIALNRSSASQSLSGITSIDGSAAKWTTARYISLAGDLAGSGLLDGAADLSISATIQPNSVALGTDTTGNYVTSITNGSYITGANGGSEGAALTLAVDATHLNTGSKVVARDASGNFGAGVISASLSGNALTATALATPRTIGLYGAASGTPTSFDGSANINIPVTAIAASSIVGTIPSTVLGNSSFYLGTTSIALNRASSSQSLTGITSIDGSAAKLTTARNIAISGDVVGFAAFDGSANVTIMTEVGTDTHAHTYYNETYSAVAPITSGTAITIPNSRTYSLGANRLSVYINGELQIAGATNDYTEYNTTSIKLNYSIPATTRVSFLISV